MFNRPAFNLLSGDRRDESTAESHTQFLVERIQTAIKDLQRLKDHRLGPPKHANDIMGLLKSLTQKLETENYRLSNQNTTNTSAVTSRPPSRMQPFPDQAQSPSNGGQSPQNTGSSQNLLQNQNGGQSSPLPLSTSQSISQQQQQIISDLKAYNPVSADFTKWMNKNLSIGASHTENATLRQLFCSVAARYQSVCELKASVQSLKQAKVPPQSIDYQLCGVQNIKKSPFLRSVQNNYRFLQTMLKQIREHRSTTIPQCEKMIADCLDALSNINSHHEKIKQDCAAQEQKLRTKIEKSSADVQSKKKQFSQFALSLCDPKNAKIKETYAGVSGTVVDDILAKMSGNSVFTEEHRKLLSDISNLRNEAKELCERSLHSMDRAFCSLNPIYSAISDLSKAVELNRQNTRKAEQLNAYAKNLSELENMLKLPEIHGWCKTIGDATAQFAKLQQDNEKLSALVRPLVEDEGEEQFEKEIDELEEKTQRLIEERIQLEHEIADAAVEHDTMSEKLFAAVQDLVAMQHDSARVRSEMEERQMMKLQKLILCPVCKDNRRECLLTTCMHPICKECMRNAKGSCPVCKTSFTQKDVKPFYFQN